MAGTHAGSSNGMMTCFFRIPRRFPGGFFMVISTRSPQTP
jgi:hypothetical protein